MVLGVLLRINYFLGAKIQKSRIFGAIFLKINHFLAQKIKIQQFVTQKFIVQVFVRCLSDCLESFCNIFRKNIFAKTINFYAFKFLVLDKNNKLYFFSFHSTSTRLNMASTHQENRRIFSLSSTYVIATMRLSLVVSKSSYYRKPTKK